MAVSAAAAAAAPLLLAQLLQRRPNSLRLEARAPYESWRLPGDDNLPVCVCPEAVRLHGPDTARLAVYPLGYGSSP